MLRSVLCPLDGPRQIRQMSDAHSVCTFLPDLEAKFPTAVKGSFSFAPIQPARITQTGK